MDTLRFWFDVISPYAYLAWTQLPALCARHGVQLEPEPVLFAGMLNALGTKGPAEVPARRAYLFKDVLRKAHALGAHVEPPPAHPFNPLLAQRACSVEMPGAQRVRLIDALYARVWGGRHGGVGVDDPQQVAAAAREAGLDAEALLAAAAGAEAKARLRENTEAALRAGAFGVPSFHVRGELFFGTDALPHLEAFLAGRDPLDRAALERWRTLPAAAKRPGAA